MIKQCIICDKDFETYDKNSLGKRKGSSRLKVRGINTITCSPKCSRIYNAMTVKERCQMKDVHYEKHKNDKN